MANGRLHRTLPTNTLVREYVCSQGYGKAQFLPQADLSQATRDTYVLSKRHIPEVGSRTSHDVSQVNMLFKSNPWVCRALSVPGICVTSLRLEPQRVPAAVYGCRSIVDTVPKTKMSGLSRCGHQFKYQGRFAGQIGPDKKPLNRGDMRGHRGNHTLISVSSVSLVTLHVGISPLQLRYLGVPKARIIPNTSCALSSRVGLQN